MKIVSFSEKNYNEKVELCKKLFQFIDRKQVAKDLIFSYVGARICYSSDYPINLFFEKKLKERDKRIDFFKKLFNLKHYSVFAHTPVLIKSNFLSKEDRLNIFRLFFKVFEFKNGDILMNLRHFAEFLPEEMFYELISLEIPEWWKEKDFRKEFELKSNVIIEIGDFCAKYLRAKLFIFNSAVKDWKVIIIHNCSRIMTHQLCRHTTINFCQRSHRYTKANSFCIPSEIAEDDDFVNFIFGTFNDIWVVLENMRKSKKYKREDLRFFMPQSTATTIFCSAPLCVWKDFVEKRNKPQAQKEIREVANILNRFLFGGKE